MFGRKSEEEKAAEAAAKVEADAKVKTIELERKAAAAKGAVEAAKKAAEAEAKKAAEAAAKKAAEVAEAAKKKTDYINEKSKLTEKELLAEILWKLSEDAKAKEANEKRIDRQWEIMRDRDSKIWSTLEKIRRIDDDQMKKLEKIHNIAEKERYDRTGIHEY